MEVVFPIFLWPPLSYQSPSPALPKNPHIGHLCSTDSPPPPFRLAEYARQQLARTVINERVRIYSRGQTCQTEPRTRKGWVLRKSRVPARAECCEKRHLAKRSHMHARARDVGKQPIGCAVVDFHFRCLHD
jgi:hypothetical protein